MRVFAILIKSIARSNENPAVSSSGMLGEIFLDDLHIFHEKTHSVGREVEEICLNTILLHVDVRLHSMNEGNGWCGNSGNGACWSYGVL